MARCRRMPSMIRRCFAAKRESHPAAAPFAARAENPWFSRGFRMRCKCELVDRQRRFGNLGGRSNLAFFQGFFVFWRSFRQARSLTSPWSLEPRRPALRRALDQGGELWSGGNGFRTLFGGIQRPTAAALVVGGAYVDAVTGPDARSRNAASHLGTSIAISGMRRKVASKCDEHR